jgi:SAM-dependent methyltransferase
VGDAETSSADQWGGSAAAWARAGEQPETGAGADAARWMLDAAELEPGEAVLEVACGAGRVGLQAARAVGPDGTVVCSDFAEPMVAAVTELAERLGLENVDARVLDALDLDLGDERFDVVLCRFGYMLMDDPALALAESRRALAPGGRIVLAVWGKGEQNPWLMTIFEAFMRHLDAPPPEPGTPGPFALGDPQTVGRLLEEAGFAESSTVTLKGAQTYGSLDEWWDEIRAVSGPLATVLAALPEADQRAIRELATNAAGEYLAADGTLVFPAAIVGALARV